MLPYSSFSVDNTSSAADAATQPFQLNNRYFGYPSLMSDGRSVFGSMWEQQRVIDANLIPPVTEIKSNWEYRQYMQQNARALMQKEHERAGNEIGYTVFREVSPSASSSSFAAEPSFMQQNPVPNLTPIYPTRDQLQASVSSSDYTLQTQQQLLEQRMIHGYGGGSGSV